MRHVDWCLIPLSEGPDYSETVEGNPRSAVFSSPINLSWFMGTCEVMWAFAINFAPFPEKSTLYYPASSLFLGVFATIG